MSATGSTPFRAPIDSARECHPPARASGCRLGAVTQQVLMRSRSMAAVVLTSLLAVGTAAAAVVVNDSSDALHSPGCATTGTGTCTLRDAITFANSNAGSDAIHFTIA